MIAQRIKLLREILTLTRKIYAAAKELTPPLQEEGEPSSITRLEELVAARGQLIAAAEALGSSGTAGQEQTDIEIQDLLREICAINQKASDILTARKEALAQVLLQVRNSKKVLAYLRPAPPKMGRMVDQHE